MYNMLQTILEKKYGLECMVYDGQVYGTDRYIICLIVSPHSGTNSRWLVRFSAAVSFDRWANSTGVEKFFDTKDEVATYLESQQLNIYKELLKYLSEEYQDIMED